jgi:hypothetical protein
MVSQELDTSVGPAGYFSFVKPNVWTSLHRALLHVLHACCSQPAERVVHCKWQRAI